MTTVDRNGSWSCLEIMYDKSWGWYMDITGSWSCSEILCMISSGWHIDITGSWWLSHFIPTMYSSFGEEVLEDSLLTSASSSNSRTVSCKIILFNSDHPNPDFCCSMFGKTHSVWYSGSVSLYKWNGGKMGEHPHWPCYTERKSHTTLLLGEGNSPTFWNNVFVWKLTPWTLYHPEQLALSQRVKK